MRIDLVKFGKVLTSRPAGKEAFLAIRPTLDPNADPAEINFDGIISLSPSWADEFLSKLKDMYGDRLIYLPSKNKSVIETMKIIETQ